MNWIKCAAAFVIVVAATTVGLPQGRGRGGGPGGKTLTTPVS